MTEQELKQLEETLVRDDSAPARKIRDMIDEVRGLRGLVQQARGEARKPQPQEASGARVPGAQAVQEEDASPEEELRIERYKELARRSA
jgi:hypothetical protein